MVGRRLSICIEAWREWNVGGVGGTIVWSGLTWLNDDVDGVWEGPNWFLRVISIC